MHGHLVAVKVGVECGTSKRMKFKSLTLYKYRLECLYAKSVKCRRTVEHYRMTLDNSFKCVPDLRLSTFYSLSCCLYVLSMTALYKYFHYKGLEKFESHLFRKTALIHFKLRTYDDNRTSGIVNTLSKKVLTETSLLALEHV